MVVGCLTTCVKHKNWLWGSSYFQLPKTFNCLLSLLEWVQLQKFEFNFFTCSFWFFSNPPICFAAQVLTLLSQNVVFPVWSISSVWVFRGGWKAVTPETNGHFSFPVRSCRPLSLCTCIFWCPHSVPAKPHYLLSIYAPCQADINFCFNIVVNKRKNDLAVWGRTAQTILKHGRWQRKRSFSAAPITWSKDLHKGERQALEENRGRPTDEHCISQQAGTCCCAPSTWGSILRQTWSCSWE